MRAGSHASNRQLGADVPKRGAFIYIKLYTVNASK